MRFIWSSKVSIFILHHPNTPPDSGRARDSCDPTGHLTLKSGEQLHDKLYLMWETLSADKVFMEDWEIKSCYKLWQQKERTPETLHLGIVTVSEALAGASSSVTRIASVEKQQLPIIGPSMVQPCLWTWGEDHCSQNENLDECWSGSALGPPHTRWWPYYEVKPQPGYGWSLSSLGKICICVFNMWWTPSYTNFS